MSLATSRVQLPSTVECKLRDIQRRQHGWAMVQIVALTVAVFLAAMTLALLFDYLGQLRSSPWRVVLTCSVWFVTLFVALRLSFRHWQNMRQPGQAAALVDQHIPQLEERWSTVVALSRSDRGPSNPVAAAMWTQVAQEAVVLSRLVQPQAIATPRAARWAAGICACSGLPLCLWALLAGTEVTILWQRFLHPLTAITATQVTSSSGDLILPRGESIELQAQMMGLLRPQAQLLIQRENQRLDEIGLFPGTSNKAALTHALRVDQSLHYKFLAGDGETPWHSITAIDTPTLAEVRFRIEPPRYSQRSPLEKTHLPQRIKVLAGSRLLWLFRPSMPLSRCELSWKVAPQENQPVTAEVINILKPQADGWYLYESTLETDGSLQLELQNLHGLTQDEPLVCRIQIQADHIPVARILGNPEESVVADDETLKIDFEAHDDLGIASAQLVVYDESGVESGEAPRILHVQEIPLGDQLLQKHVLGTVELDLAQLQLPPGSQISYSIRVTDNRDELVKLPVDADASPDSSSDRSASTELASHSVQPASKEMTRTAENKNSSQAIISSGDDNSTEPLASAGASDDFESAAELITAAPVSALFPANLMGNEESFAGVVDPAAVSALDPENLRRPSDGRQTGMTDTVVSGQVNPPNRSRSSAAHDQEHADPANTPDHLVADSQSQSASEPQSSSNSPGDSQQRNSSFQKTQGSDATPPPPDARMLAAQEASSTETQRRKLRITERLTAIAKADDVSEDALNLRDMLVKTDKLLGHSEEALMKLIERSIPDSQRPLQLQIIDEQLGQVEQWIAQLREETRDSQMAFVGLQMVDISRTHVSPAREHVFIAQRESLAESERNATRALQSVLRARELLAALLVRFDRSQRDARLAESLEAAGKMYEVYVERSQLLLREAQQNRHPLDRKMSFIEVDQDYLDRYAEVLRLRRDMLDEFARLLGDDPRLLSRYLELTKRRRASLREQLATITEQQQIFADEVAGWLQVEEAQRANLLSLMFEVRWEWAGELAKDSASLAEHVEKQLPLVLDANQGSARMLIRDVHSLASVAREIALDARRYIRNPDSEIPWQSRADQFLQQCRRVEADLDRLSYHHADQEDVIDYVTTRLPEVRVVTDQSVRWRKVITAFEQHNYPVLAELDQRQLSLTTELLRVELLDMPADLATEFNRQQTTSVPTEILTQVSELQSIMEAVTFTQQAATFAMSERQLANSAIQQRKTLEYLAAAEQLFDKIRRKVAETLDEIPEDNPNIADLRDPTLDEFLAQLEREPNLEALLGIPNRRRNLRTIADNLETGDSGSSLLQQASEDARSRARSVLRETSSTAAAPPREMTDEERQEQALAEKQQQQLAAALAQVQKQLKDPQASPQQHEQLQKIEQQLQRALQSAQESPGSHRRWQQLTEADQAQAALQALARGQRLPDDQWNKVLSALGDGLWQVGGRTPPEEYRRAIEQYHSRLRALFADPSLESSETP